MFGFGSCGSWSISVRFGSVLGTFCIDICFFLASEKQIQIASCKRFIASHKRFMSSGFQRAERAELGKPKLPEIVSACNLL